MPARDAAMSAASLSEDGVVADGAQRRPTFAEALELQRIDDSTFIAPAAGGASLGALFGGTLAAQALRSAGLTVTDDRSVHSLHSYFLRPGNGHLPVTLRVDRVRDGRNYSNRQVTALQGDRPILVLTASFQRYHEGPDNQLSTIPPVSMAEKLPVHAMDERLLDMEAREAEDSDPTFYLPTRLWVRVKEQLPDDPAHACALTFITDLNTGLGKVPGAELVGLMSSLDHTVWFHRPIRANDWLLLDMTPESTSGGRGLYTGRVYDRDGALVATMAQECLFELADNDFPPAGPRSAAHKAAE